MVTKQIDPLSEEEKLRQREIIKQRIITKERRKRKRLAITGVCVSVVLFLSFWGIFSRFNDLTIYSAGTAEKLVMLNDGTTVLLTKGSQLKVKNSFFDPSRNVYLNGTAIFKVTKLRHHPFTVHTGNYATTVYGTVFKISQSKQAFKVDLYEGSVSVTSKEIKKSYHLKPRQTFSNYGNKTIAVVMPTNQSLKSTIVTNETNLPEVHFADCTVGDALKTLEKMLGKKIEIPQEYLFTKVSIDLQKQTPEKIIAYLADYLDLKIIQHEQIYKLEK